MEGKVTKKIQHPQKHEDKKKKKNVQESKNSANQGKGARNRRGCE